MTRIIKSFFSAFAALLLLTSHSAFAQQIDKKADELFKSHCFEKATERYLKVFNSNPSNKANPAMLKRITESILSSEMLRDTARYFADLYLQFEPDDAEGYFMSAQAHYHAHDFDIALQRLDSFMVRATSEQDIIDADLLNSWIRNARRMLKDTLRNPIINLGDVINTQNNEINPYIINDGHSLVFSCDDKFDRDAVITVFNIKSSDQTALSWSPAKKVSTINTLADEYPTGPTPDGFFFCTNNSGSNFSLNTTQYSTGGRCSEGEKMPSPINMPGSEVAGCLSPSGDTIYFSATNDYGDLDIFYAIRSYNGKWMKPRPVPGLINREGFDENYPYVANDGTRLYFASNREGTMGGYDIFYSDFDFRKNEWGKPVQLPYPINDTYDNMTISFTPDNRYAYVSLFRSDSMGGRDIYAILFDHVLPTSAIVKYKVTLRNAKRKPVEITTQPNIEIRNDYGELVAIERINMRTNSFVVVLDPGSYTMTIDMEGAKHFEKQIVVSERTYDATPIESSITLESLQ